LGLGLISVGLPFYAFWKKSKSFQRREF
jgi:hypothetical protein